jgi:aryl-alcohol dehydrogenase-like predicted oxidoreductase
MKYSKLGTSGLDVSRVCLGTMTWGEQNSEADAHAQMDYAFTRGINFFDTAELYAVPISAPTQGKTEEMIGTWFAKSGKRQDVILSSKVVGQGISWIRNGEKLTGKSVKTALEGSLKRLQTDYIDLYQLHWPNRIFPHFGRNHAGVIDFTADDTKRIEENLHDLLQALGDVVKEGKVRYVGLSDDSAWGIMKYIELSKIHDLPRMVSIQNEFSLLCNSDDPYIAETCVREDVAYLSWSPLATGMLSGKYADGHWPEGSRWAVENGIQNGHFKTFRDNPQAHAAVSEYIQIAKKYELDVTQMALKWIDKQSFVTSTIIGATTMDQLKSNIDAFDIELGSDIMSDIHDVLTRYPIPY